jgi:hypothetical protein
MKFKRLRHHVQNFAQMFCGWELMFDYKTLADLGGGTLRIDILNGTVVFNDETEISLSTVQGIRNWMIADLADSEIDLKKIQSAVLIVKFETRRELGLTEQSTSWADPTPHFVKCKISCESSLEADNKKLTSSYLDFHEWPESYSWIK